MTQHEEQAVTFQIGDVKALPHTLSSTRHLTLTLVDTDAEAGTATFELHNPDAEPDSRVEDLIDERIEDVEHSNEWRDNLHLPELAVPVDTFTQPVETLHWTLHEKLQIGDRRWTVTNVADRVVTLTPGHDHQADTFLNELEDLAYSPGVIAGAEAANTLDEAL